MIPINRENLRDVIIAVLCIAAACGLFYLAGCGKPARYISLPPTPLSPQCIVYDGIKWVPCSSQQQPVQSIGKLGDWQLSSNEAPIEVSPGGIGHGEGYYPLPAKNLGADASPPKIPQVPVWNRDPTQPEIPVPGAVNEIAQPLSPTAEQGGQSSAIEGVNQLRGHPMGEQNPAIDSPLYVEKGLTGQAVTGLCPNSKTLAYGVVTGFDKAGDAIIGWTCNGRQIEPVQKWRYVDQKRYGYQEWEEK